MKSKSIITIMTLSAALFTVSCDDIKFGENLLEKPLTTDMNIDGVYSHKIYAEQALAQAYHTLPDFLPHGNRLRWSMLESVTDLADYIKSGGSEYHRGSITAADASSSVYSLSYNTSNGEMSALYGFRAAHLFIDNIDRVPDMTEDEKAIRKAEAKLIIAFHNVDAFRYLGGIPWIDKAYSPTDKMQMERLTVDAMITKTCNLIDEADSNLPWSTSAEEDGHMTKAAGLALKTRMLLFAASPLFNSATPYKSGEAADKKYVWFGNYDKARWQKALDAGLAFMQANQDNGNFYKLVSTGNPRMDYRNGYFKRYNHEVIIGGHRFTKYNVNSNAFSQIKYGVCLPTLNYVDMFPKKDGTAFDWNNLEDRAYPFFDAEGQMTRDPRLYETVIVNQDDLMGTKAKIYAGGKHGPKDYGSGQYWRWRNEGWTGMGLRKLVLDQLNQVNNKFYQCPLLRLPEIYLSIAEAMNELGIATQKDKFGYNAYDYINLLHARVDMPDVDETLVTPGDKLRQAILDERALEFGFEEVHYFDIVRFKRVDLLKKSLRRLVTFFDKRTKKYTYEIQEKMVNQRMWIKNWDDKYYLNFFPVDEINKKYGLVQNPGWE